MKITSITQFKKALEQYYSTYIKYFKNKVFEIDYGGCGEFAYLLNQPIQKLVDHFGLNSQVKISYVFLDYAYDIDCWKHTKQSNRKCIRKFKIALNEKLEKYILDDLLADFDFSHVMLKIKIGSVSWFIDSDTIYKSRKELERETDKYIVFDSGDFELLFNLIEADDMWNSAYAFYQDRDGAMEKIGKPLQIMANNLIKKL